MYKNILNCYISVWDGLLLIQRVFILERALSMLSMHSFGEMKARTLQVAWSPCLTNSQVIPVSWAWSILGMMGESEMFTCSHGSSECMAMMTEGIKR